ncbi:MAG TPA: M55 family metallopeptidase [Thermomicrobiaceae bacterium]|nr:M55 family metallopeptidase [Thermomicrobiaceae bacterium]
MSVAAGRALIIADIEGIAGVDDHRRDLAGGTPGYEKSCDLMTAEVASATRGLVQVGVTDVLVIDAHSSGRNIRRDALPAPARFLDAPGMLNQLREAVALGLDAVVLLGFHAAAGTPDAFMPHSFHVDTRSWIDGVEVGEPSFIALHCARHRIPVVLNAGDQYTLMQTAMVAPQVPQLQTKRSTSMWTAESRDPAEVQREVEAAAADGWARRLAIGTGRVPGRVELELQSRNRVGFDLVSCIPGTVPAQRENAVSFTGEWDEVFDMFVVANTVVSFLSFIGSSYYFGAIEDGLIPRLSQLPGAREARREWFSWWFQPDWHGSGTAR